MTSTWTPGSLNQTGANSNSPPPTACYQCENTRHNGGTLDLHRRLGHGHPFACPANLPEDVCFDDAVYGPKSKSTADIEDFALLRSNGVPTYHKASSSEGSIAIPKIFSSE